MAEIKILAKENVSRDMNGRGKSACASLNRCSHLGKNLALSSKVKIYGKSDAWRSIPLRGSDPGDLFTRKRTQDSFRPYS